MEIHKPRAAHSWREFVVEIGTITIGIVIALGLESLIEAGRNHETVDAARAQIIAELKTNHANLAEAVQAAKTDERTLQAYIDYGEKRLRHLPARFPSEAPLPGDFTALGTSGWESALAAQALVHMPFAQTNLVAKAYASTRAFNGLEEKIEPEWFHLSAIGNDPAHLSDSEMSAVVADLRVALVYQTAAAQVGDHTLGEYDQAIAALQR